MNASPSPDARWRPVVALLLVGVVIAGLTRWCPPDGWTVGDSTLLLQLPEGWSNGLNSSSKTPVIPRWKPEDVEDLLAAYDAQLAEAESNSPPASEAPSSDSSAAGGGPTVDSIADLSMETAFDSLPASATRPLDSVQTATEAPADLTAAPAAASPQKAATPTQSASSTSWVPGALRVRIPESQPQMLDRLWERLQAGQDVHILHYGDSQIEGDRISGTLRARWQERWGGFGPGIQPPIPLVQSFSLRQSNRGSWTRHTRFGRRDTTDQDENYGLLASYADAEHGDPNASLCLSVGREPRSPKGFGMWTALELWHDTVHSPCILQLNGTAVDTLRPGDPSGVLTWPGSAMMPGDPDMELCFSAVPPRLFALHPVGGGVQWHGVAMRGSSGTLFRKLNRRVYADQLERLSPDLVVLQFGGNSVPYCRDTTAAQRYAGWMKRQIQLFQALQPEAAILVIGPSDMAEKTGVHWTSYPMLSPIRDALLEASLDAGAAYWDLLEVMGGLGSMPAWVAAQPPLAGPDHVHFTPRGARKVGELLDRSLWAEFRRWEEGGASSPMNAMQPKSAGNISIPSSLQHVP